MENETRAVLLNDNTCKSPLIAQVLAGFHKVPLLDITPRAKACRGIAAEKLEPAQAEALAQAFQKAGIPARTVPDALLPAPPTPENVRRVELADAEFQPEGAGPMRWDQVIALLAFSLKPAQQQTAAKDTSGMTGNVLTTHFESPVMDALSGAFGSPAANAVNKIMEDARQAALVPMRKAASTEPLYFIGLVDAQSRSLWLDMQRFDFSCLKEKKQLNLLSNFRALVVESARRAPQAKRSLGARIVVGSGLMKDMLYESTDEIAQEYRWLLAP